jgi:hypothetical protein
MISNCDDVRGMIPWLLNGTLTDDERQQVLRHLTTCETCRQELADTRLAAEIFDQHPPAGAILALAWDETPRGIDPAFLEEHLAGCPRCAAELELARMSRHLEEDDKVVPLTPRRAPPAPTPATGWRGWKSAAVAAALVGVVAFAGWFQTAGRVQTLEERLAGRPAAPAPAQPPPAGSGEDARVRQLAAQLEERGQRIEQLEAQLNEVERQATALSGQVDRLAEARPAAPQVNSWAGSILPSVDVARGTRPAGPTDEVPGGKYATLLLTSAGRGTHREHAIEIVDATGKVVWSTAGLTRNDDGDYSLTLPPGALRAGTYTIRVYGLADGRREPLESYSIRVK